MSRNERSITVADQRKLHYDHLLSLLPHLTRRLGWSRGQIEAHQRVALRRLLAHAKRRSPWHANRLANVTPESFELAELNYLPIMNKTEMMKNWDEIITVPGATLEGANIYLRDFKEHTYIWEDHTLLASGGSGGRPGLFVYGWDAMAINCAGTTRSIPRAHHQGGEARKRAIIAAEPSLHGSYIMPRIFSGDDQRTLQLSAWRKATPEMLGLLNDFQPAKLTCYPTLMPSLSASVRAGELSINPDIIVFASEPVSDANHQIAVETWPAAKIFDAWATTEGSGTFPCPNGNGFHVCEDLVIIEAVDASGRPTPPGEKSAGIYLTNLFNHSQPIIRYYIDDIFEFDTETCGCGLAYRRIKKVHGRTFEKFIYGTVAVHPLSLELAVIEQQDVMEYQIRQTQDGVSLIYRSDGGINEAQVVTQMKKSLLSYGLECPIVDVTRAQHIDRTGAGKLKRFVPLPQ